jgi:hypothetical protein
MNSLRLRVVKLKPDHGAGTEFPFAIQVGQDGLNWWTIIRKKTFDDALITAKDLVAFMERNIIVKEEVVLWTAKM